MKGPPLESPGEALGTEVVAPERRMRTWLLRSAKWILPLAVIAVGIVTAMLLAETGPKAERKPAVRRARLVDVVEAQRVDARVRLQAMGPAMVASEIELKPQVIGEIVELSAEVVPGGLFETGQLIARIDPRDYELAVRQRESDVTLAERDLKLEMGQQLVAHREFELLGEVIAEEDRELVLRVPQLASAEQRVAAAEAALEDARLDLERTELRAPFNAIVRTKNVDRGEIVGIGTVIATLVGTDEYWIEVSVPVHELRWIRIPRRGNEPGSSVRIYNESGWGKGVSREGRVLRLASDLEESGRMARLLIAIKDPMSLEPAHDGLPMLLIGSYIRVEIDGKQVRSVISIDRSLLRDGDVVWLMNEDAALEMRPVEITYRGRDHVLVSAGLEPGDRIVVTDIAAPVAGMPLRVREERSSGSDADSAADAALIIEPYDPGT